MISSDVTAGRPPDIDTARNVVRGVGLALLGGAIAIDVIAPVIVRWRRAVAVQALKWTDQVAPTENFMLDAAVELLRASESRPS